MVHLFCASTFVPHLQSAFLMAFLIATDSCLPLGACFFSTFLPVGFLPVVFCAAVFCTCAFRVDFFVLCCPHLAQVTRIFGGILVSFLCRGLISCEKRQDQFDCFSRPRVLRTPCHG